MHLAQTQLIPGARVVALMLWKLRHHGEPRHLKSRMCGVSRIRIRDSLDPGTPLGMQKIRAVLPSYVACVVKMIRC
jgi:hypothetical protein